MGFYGALAGGFSPNSPFLIGPMTFANTARKSSNTTTIWRNTSGLANASLKCSLMRRLIDFAGQDVEYMHESAGSSSSLGQISKDSANRYIREVTDISGLKLFQCILCQMTTKHANSAYRHMVIKHTKKALPNQHCCQYCFKSFANKFYLTNHLASKTCIRNMKFDP